VELTGPVEGRHEEILTPEALGFLATLQREFGARRRELLGLRAGRQEELAQGATLDFPADSADVRNDDTWRVADPAPGLEDRRVEITAPPTAR
jgi:malate synthase